MGSVQRNPNGDCIEDTSVEQLLSPDSPDMYNVFGDPELHPRVGEEYQVEIPPLISESRYRLYRKNPFEVKSMAVIPCDFLMGLPIPVMHINKEVRFAKHEGISNDNGLPLEDGLMSGKSASVCERERKRKAYQKCKSKGYHLLPGSIGNSWSEIEEGSFLLGLYIFGKDLVMVKKIVENKRIGDIQSFYYGKFYRSDEYRRWSECRKVRSRKCVYGHKIFSGMRQQELLSRLFLHASGECQNTLSEVSKTFNEGKISLNEYVFTLKAIVGMSSFIEAVGIGKGRRDLTSITMEPPKSSNVAPSRPEMPSGKACSSLTHEEIMKFLTGDFRLSKARSNDLFWEAVWPRLLARGWHSEQPKDQIYAVGSKGSLVFLIPGVKKFSRRKLVRGNHYFDCVSDVLSKVASDPSLLELDSEGGESNRNKEEDGWTNEMKSEKDDISGHRRHCYLQPRTPNRNTGLMKFTVVDTSMADGKVFKIRELRTLPDEVLKKSISKIHSEESDQSGSSVSSEDSDIEDTMVVDQEDTINSGNTKMVPPIAILSEKTDIETSSETQGPNGFDSEKASTITFKENNVGEGKKLKKSLKCHRGMKKDDLKYLSPVTKRRRKLSSCTRTQTNHQNLNLSVVPSFGEDKRAFCSEATDSSENNKTNVFRKGNSSSSSLKESTFEGSQGFSCETNICSEGDNDKLQSHSLIDLNFPQVLPEFENGEVQMTGLRDEIADQTSKPENVAVPESTAEVTSSDQQSNMNSRRQSTRNRPPTMKALEALANGFLTINSRKRKKEVGPKKTTSTRTRQHANSSMEGTEDLGNGSEDTQMVEVENGACDVDSDMFGKFQGLPKGNAAQNLC